jgi:hypothetical protein
MTVPANGGATSSGYAKMGAAALAGAITTVLVYAVDQFLRTPVPAEVVAALQTIVTTFVVWATPHSFGN